MREYGGGFLERTLADEAEGKIRLSAMILQKCQEALYLNTGNGGIVEILTSEHDYEKLCCDIKDKLEEANQKYYFIDDEKALTDILDEDEIIETGRECGILSDDRAGRVLTAVNLFFGVLSGAGAIAGLFGKNLNVMSRQGILWTALALAAAAAGLVLVRISRKNKEYYMTICELRKLGRTNLTKKFRRIEVTERAFAAEKTVWLVMPLNRLEKETAAYVTACLERLTGKKQLWILVDFWPGEGFVRERAKADFFRYSLLPVTQEEKDRFYSCIHVRDTGAKRYLRYAGLDYMLRKEMRETGQERENKWLKKCFEKLLKGFSEEKKRATVRCVYCAACLGNYLEYDLSAEELARLLFDAEKGNEDRLLESELGAADILTAGVLKKQDFQRFLDKLQEIMPVYFLEEGEGIHLAAELLLFLKEEYDEMLPGSQEVCSWLLIKLLARFELLGNECWFINCCLLMEKYEGKNQRVYFIRLLQAMNGQNCFSCYAEIFLLMERRRMDGRLENDVFWEQEFKDALTNHLFYRFDEQSIEWHIRYMAVYAGARRLKLLPAEQFSLSESPFWGIWNRDVDELNRYFQILQLVQSPVIPVYQLLYGIYYAIMEPGGVLFLPKKGAPVIGQRYGFADELVCAVLEYEITRLRRQEWERTSAAAKVIGLLRGPAGVRDYGSQLLYDAAQGILEVDGFQSGPAESGLGKLRKSYLELAVENGCCGIMKFLYLLRKREKVYGEYGTDCSLLDLLLNIHHFHNHSYSQGITGFLMDIMDGRYGFRITMGILESCMKSGIPARKQVYAYILENRDRVVSVLEKDVLAARTYNDLEVIVCNIIVFFKSDGLMRGIVEETVSSIRRTGMESAAAVADALEFIYMSDEEARKAALLNRLADAAGRLSSGTLICILLSRAMKYRLEDVIELVGQMDHDILWKTDVSACEYLIGNYLLYRRRERYDPEILKIFLEKDRNEDYNDVALLELVMDVLELYQTVLPPDKWWRKFGRVWKKRAELLLVDVGEWKGDKKDRFGILRLNSLLFSLLASRNEQVTFTFVQADGPEDFRRCEGNTGEQETYLKKNFMKLYAVLDRRSWVVSYEYAAAVKWMRTKKELYGALLTIYKSDLLLLCHRNALQLVGLCQEVYADDKLMMETFDGMEQLLRTSISLLTKGEKPMHVAERQA